MILLHEFVDLRLYDGRVLRLFSYWWYTKNQIKRRFDIYLCEKGSRIVGHDFEKVSMWRQLIMFFNPYKLFSLTKRKLVTGMSGTWRIISGTCLADNCCRIAVLIRSTSSFSNRWTFAGSWNQSCILNIVQSST